MATCHVIFRISLTMFNACNVMSDTTRKQMMVCYIN